MTTDPPSLPEIERAVLGAMIIDDEAISKAMEIITVESFYVPVNQILFKAMTDMYSSNKPIDGLTLEEYLFAIGRLDTIGGPPAIAGLMSEATTSANIEYHCGLIKNKETLRRIISLSKASEASCYKADAEPSGVADNMMAGIFEIKNSGKNRKYITMLEMSLEAHDAIMKHVGSKDLIGITTGFYKLDILTEGWQDGDLIILAGLTASGKTALSLNFARNAAAKGKEVAIFSMEMPNSQLGKRLIGIEAELDVRRKNYTKEEMKKISDASAAQKKYPIFTDDSSGLTHQTLYAKLKALKNDRNIKLAIIDHLQLMVGTTEFKGNRRMQIEEITRHMKGYAKDLSIPIILLSQLSRASDKENRKPKLSDLRESGSIEQDADIVIFIYEPEIKEIKERIPTLDKAENVVEIIVGKQRNGPTGSFYLYRHKDFTLFNNMEY